MLSSDSIVALKKINKSFEENEYSIDNETINDIVYLYCKMERKMYQQ